MRLVCSTTTYRQTDSQRAQSHQLRTHRSKAQSQQPTPHPHAYISSALVLPSHPPLLSHSYHIPPNSRIPSSILHYELYTAHFASVYIHKKTFKFYCSVLLTCILASFSLKHSRFDIKERGRVTNSSTERIPSGPQVNYNTFQLVFSSVNNLLCFTGVWVDKQPISHLLKFTSFSIAAIFPKTSVFTSFIQYHINTIPPQYNRIVVV